jgi:AraC-like DNA-binding protein
VAAGPGATRFAVPSARLRPYVDRYWWWTAAPGTPLPRLLPGTGAELFFHLGAPFAIVAARRGSSIEGGPAPLPPAHFLAPRAGAPQLVATGPVSFLAVRFRAGALAHLAVAPPEALLDRPATAIEILGPEGEALDAAVRAAPDHAARLRALDLGLTALLARRGLGRTAADRAVARLYYRAGRERVAATAAALGLSLRQLERLVAARTGVGPKRFQRLARFHHVARRLRLEPGLRPLDAALDGGYVDQPHFVHDVRALTGLTPGALFGPDAGASHFYNPRLPPPRHLAVLIEHPEEDAHDDDDRG